MSQDWTDFEIVEVEEPSRIVEEGVGLKGKRHTRGTYRLRGLPGGGTEISFELEWLERGPRRKPDPGDDARLHPPAQRQSDAPPRRASSPRAEPAQAQRRLEDEDLDRHVGVEVVVGHEGEDLAPGEPGDGGLHLLGHGALGEPAHGEHRLALVVGDEGLLGPGQHFEHDRDQGVAAVEGVGLPRPAADRRRVDADQLAGDRGVQLSAAQRRGGLLALLPPHRRWKRSLR